VSHHVSDKEHKVSTVFFGRTDGSCVMIMPKTSKKLLAICLAVKPFFTLTCMGTGPVPKVRVPDSCTCTWNPFHTGTAT
jgi:hypothetical protein